MDFFKLTILLCALIAVVYAQTPTQVPFLGNWGTVTNVPSQTPLSVGQVITKVSDIQKVKVWVRAVASAGYVTCKISEWVNGGPGGWSTSKLFLVPQSTTFDPAIIDFTNASPVPNSLDPSKQYLIQIQSPNNNYPYDVALSATPDGSIGGLVYISPALVTNLKMNVIMEIQTNSMLTLPNPATNFATGRGNTPWTCLFKTTFSAIQVNWYTMKVNTAWASPGTTTVIWEQTPGTCNPNGNAIRYGVVTKCTSGAGQGSIDLTGTPFKVTSTFAAGGSSPYYTSTFSQNNQKVDFSGGGWCGWVGTTDMVAAGEAGAQNGGYYINIAHI